MKKIKADSVLKRLGFKYTWVNDRCMIVISTHPKGSEGGLRVYLGSDTSIVDYDNSVYELDFQDSKQEVRKSLFEVGDTVYVLHDSGEFGVSVQGEVTFINVGVLEIKINNNIAKYHLNKVSFTPFSIHEGGFSQVRQKPKPKTGDWGWFWNNDNNTDVDGFRYGRLRWINNNNKDTQYRCFNGWDYNNFSLENPVKHD